MADHRRGGAALSVLSHRFAPTTSGACCGRRRCWTPALRTPRGASTPPSCGRSRTTRSSTPSACRRRSGCSRPPTASSAAPRGTWTSSTRWAGSAGPSDDLVVHFRNAEGEDRLHAGGAAGRRQARAGGDDLRRRLRVRARHYEERGQADDPVAEHGPLPRRPGGDRPGRLRRLRRVLGRPGGRLRRRGAGGWPSSAARTCSSTTRASRT